jgi:hypothetical protein
MADLMTAGDSLRIYLTGVSADGTAQPNPDLSLGNHRSSTEWGGMAVFVDSADANTNLTIDYTSGGNAEGLGVLSVLDANTVQWFPPGDAVGGDPVIIHNGESKVVEGSSRGAFLRVTRTTADDLTPGHIEFIISEPYYNAVAMGPVPPSLATAGGSQYRAVILKNVSAFSVLGLKIWIPTYGTDQVSDGAHLGSSGTGTITTTGSFADWPAEGFCHVYTSAQVSREVVYYSSRTDTTLTVPAAGRGLLGTAAATGTATDIIRPVPGIAVGAEPGGPQAAGAAIQTIANESTAPAGVTFNTEAYEVAGIAGGDLPPGYQIGVWVRRQIPAGMIASPSVTEGFRFSFDSV